MKTKLLNSNVLKLLGCLFMLCDHIGMLLLPQVIFLRIVGRLAFPIFAFFISEGCKYTHNKIKYFLLILIMGGLFFAVQCIATGIVMLNVFVTFACSILLIYVLQYIKLAIFAESKKTAKIFFLSLLFCTLTALLYLLCYYIRVDYGFWGIILPVAFALLDFSFVQVPIFLSRLDNLYCKLLLGLLCLVPICLTAILPYEWVSVFSLLLLALYSGERGSKKLKYFFYLFYPVHIALLYGISFLL